MRVLRLSQNTEVPNLPSTDRMITDVQNFTTTLTGLYRHQVTRKEAFWVKKKKKKGYITQHSRLRVDVASQNQELEQKPWSG